MIFPDFTQNFRKMTNSKTADLCDQFMDQLQVLEPIFQAYGQHDYFEGPIYTLKVFEDNTLVRETLSEPGQGRVLVVDGGGSLRCALLGDNLAAMAVKNDWKGIIIYGCIRDSEDISTMEIGVKALDTFPVKSIKRGEGQKDIPVHFAGVRFASGDYIYADPDGIVLAKQKLA